MNKEGIKIGILGATGNVGLELLKLLEGWDQERLPLSAPPVLFGTARSAGKVIKFRGEELIVKESTVENLDGLDLIISTANGEVSEHLVPEALKRGTKLVIDTDSYYRMEEHVPLVVAGVNDYDIDRHQGIIAGPNCTTAQLIIPLKVLDQAFGLERVVVSTYQAISGAGKAAIDTMLQEAKGVLQATESYIEASAGAPKITELETRMSEDQLAFNLIPMISRLQDNGYSKEETKVQIETRKMLSRPDLRISCTAVRVPVINGHSEAVNIQLRESADVNAIVEALSEHSFLQVYSDPSEYPMPIDVSGSEPVHVGRIRKDESQENTFDMWIVADNLLIGAALNAIRVAESAYQRDKI